MKRLLGCLGALLLVTGCDQKGKNCSREQIEPWVKAIVEDMLENEPEKFVKAIDKAVANQNRKALQEVEQKATEAKDRFWASSLVIGNKDAKLKLAVFIDPLDPLSQKFRDEVMTPLAKERSDIGFFLIPVCVYNSESGKGPNSIDATKALLMAAQQNAAAAMELWTKFPPVDTEMAESQMLKWAADAKLDAEKLKQDIKSDKAQQSVIENGRLAVTLGIPPQLPFTFVMKPDGTLIHIPAFVKEKMVLVLDAVRDGKPWQDIVTSPAKGEAAAQGSSASA